MERLKLTPRQKEVLECLSRGQSNREIGDTLGIQLGTVETHLKRIYRKLHVSNRVEAAVKYLEGRHPYYLTPHR